MNLWYAYPDDLKHVKDLSFDELKKHAQVTLDNGCKCLTNLPSLGEEPISFTSLCFCCQCLVFHRYEAWIEFYDYKDDVISMTDAIEICRK
jgi:hypothetical protein